MAKVALLDKEFFLVAKGEIDSAKFEDTNILIHNSRYYVYQTYVDDVKVFVEAIRQPYVVTEF